MSTVIEHETYDDPVVDEHADEPADEPVDDENVKATVVDDFSSIASKTVKKLSANERAKLIGDFEKGHDNPYFKVMRMKNGQIRISKRREPLCNDASSAPDSAKQRIEQKLKKGGSTKHLTNEQLLMEHIIDLETRYEQMRMKHKKLKKRYNALENTIYEDDDDVPQDITPRLSTPETQQAEPEPEPVEQEPVEQAPAQPVRRVRTTRSSWRNYVGYM